MIRRAKVRLTVVDRDNNEGVITFHVIPSLLLDSILEDAIDRIVPAIQSIIDATIVAVRAEHTATIEAPATATGNPLKERMFVMWRNSEDRLATLQIPAYTSAMMFSNDGRYGVFDYTDEFDTITELFDTWLFYDRQGEKIDGAVVAAAAII